MGVFYRWLGDGLSLYVRQLAWLHAVPEVKHGKTTKQGEKSRFDDLGEAALVPPNPAPHIVDWLMDIGPTAPDAAPLSWRDIAAWQSITGIELEPWEGRLIRRLSGDFAAMRLKAEKSECPPPWTGSDEDIASNRNRVAMKVKAMFHNGRK